LASFHIGSGGGSKDVSDYLNEMELSQVTGESGVRESRTEKQQNWLKRKTIDAGVPMWKARKRHRGSCTCVDKGVLLRFGRCWGEYCASGVSMHYFVHLLLDTAWSRGWGPSMGKDRSLSQ